MTQYMLVGTWYEVLQSVSKIGMKRGTRIREKPLRVQFGIINECEYSLFLKN